MQVWDLLGLYFCCQEPYDDHIEPVPQSYAGADDEGVRLTLKPVAPRRVAFEPYPFDVRPCRVQLAFRTVPARPSRMWRPSGAPGSRPRWASSNSSWCRSR